MSGAAGGPPLVLFGAGRMGGALLKAWPDENIIVIEPHPAEWLRELAAKNDIALNSAESKAAGILVLAVKPQFMADALVQAQDWIGDQTLVLSVAAGWTIAQLGKGLGGHGRIIRVMPNTPATVGRGMSVLCANKNTDESDRKQAAALFEAVGKVAWLEDEGLMDAVTALSGSGPAYAFLLAEAMAAAGQAQGLSAELALELATATVAGAGEMMWRDLGNPAELREAVTSPGGTTAAALEVLMPGMAELLDQAIAKATARGKKLGG